MEQPVYNYPVWQVITVTFCNEWRLWCVTAQDYEGDIETLDYCHHKAVAVQQAMIYAFDTSCGPARGEEVVVYTKGFKRQKTITEGTWHEG